MPTAETTLVVFLSTTLLIFLVLAIVATSILIAILKDARKIVERAEEATENVADITKMISSKVAPVAISAAVAAVFKRFGKDSSDKKK